MHGLLSSDGRMQYSLFTKQRQPSPVLTHNQVIKGTAASLTVYQTFSFLAKVLLPLCCSRSVSEITSCFKELEVQLCKFHRSELPLEVSPSQQNPD